MELKIKYHTDPGHGWIETTKAELKRLNLKDKITPYSYQNNNYVYLEEDCDASKYLDALKKEGNTYKIEEIIYNQPCMIRTMQGYATD